MTVWWLDHVGAVRWLFCLPPLVQIIWSEQPLTSAWSPEDEPDLLWTSLYLISLKPPFGCQFVFKVKCLNYSWMECYEIWYRCSWAPKDEHWELGQSIQVLCCRQPSMQHIDLPWPGWLDDTSTNMLVSLVFSSSVQNCNSSPSVYDQRAAKLTTLPSAPEIVIVIEQRLWTLQKLYPHKLAGISSQICWEFICHCYMIRIG